MNAREWPRLALTAFIMVLLGYATLHHYSEAIEQTVVAITMLAVGYWLGSSKGSSDKTDMLATPREVEVVNDSTDPVPTTNSDGGA